MAEIIKEGKIVIKYVRCKLYICNDCENYFTVDQAELDGVTDGKDTEYFDVCPDCKSSNIVLNEFDLKVSKLEEVK